MSPKTNRRNFLKISSMLSLSGLLGQSCAQAKTEPYSTPQGKAMRLKLKLLWWGQAQPVWGGAHPARRRL